jgi:transglutaminase/protease-like cytokinesis protein 3
MDLLGIECVSVHGSAYDDREEHAWNMVKLDGGWYCVDVTWDDPIGQFGSTYTFFNVTSNFMHGTDHQWDESSVPEATATKYANKASRIR